jgi:hypothetical protein
MGGWFKDEFENQSVISPEMASDCRGFLCSAAVLIGLPTDQPNET